MSTTPEEFISIANQAKDWITQALSILFMLSMIFYARLRAGSSVFIRERIWRILGGRRSFYRKEFQDEWQRLCDLEKFNYSTGIRVSSHDRAIELISWLRERDIHLEELVRVRKYFNSKTFCLRKPCLSTLKAFGATATILLILVTPIFSFSGSGALLKIKKTDTYLWISDETARALTGPGWVISKQDCEAASPTALEYDKEVSCSALSDEESKTFVRETIRSQQLLASLLFLLSGFFLVFAMRGLSIGKQAAALYERTNKAVDNGAALSTNSNG